MADQLQIAIGADVSGLEKGLDRAQAAVGKFDASVKKSVAASGQAQQALVNLGRVASDAPFGFIAIANNIEPLIQSFQSLGRQSGGLGGTLKALGASLAGPTGLLLGFSLVSSAITVITQKYGSLGNAISALLGNQDDLTIEIDKAAKSYDKYAESIRSVEEIQRTAGAATAGQIANVQSLAGIIADTNVSYAARKTALEELKRIDKDYFGNLDLESLKYEDLKTKVDAYTASIIQQAKIKALTEEIGKQNVLLSEQAALLPKLQKRQEEAIAAQRRGAQQVIPGIAQAAAANQLSSAINETNRNFDVQNTKVSAVRARLQELEDQLKALNLQYIEGTANIKKTNQQQGNQTNTINQTTQAVKLLTEAERERLRARAEPVSGLSTVQNQQSLFAAPQVEQSISQLDKFKAAINQTLVAPESLKFAEQVQAQALTNAQERLQALQSQVQLTQEALASALGPAIDGVFNAISNGTSVIDSLKDSLKRLLVQLAANAAKAFLLKTALNFIPGGQILGGAGLLGGAGGGLGGILGGLLGGGSLPAIGRAAAPSFTGNGITGGNLNLAGNVVFTQRGTDLVGVLNAGNARINRVG
jgi:hypothetical protein